MEFSLNGVVLQVMKSRFTDSQIKPEERILEAKFGEALVDYKAKVKLWI